MDAVTQIAKCNDNAASQQQHIQYSDTMESERGPFPPFVTFWRKNVSEQCVAFHY